MKFLRLSLVALVCLGFAVMFGATSADAQDREVDSIKVSGLLLRTPVTTPGTLRPILVTLEDRGGLPISDVTVTFSSVAANAEFAASGAGPFMPTYADKTSANGLVGAAVRITAIDQGPVTIQVEADGARLLYPIPIDPARPEEPALIIVNRPSPDTGLAVGSTFTQVIEIDNATDLAAWQMDIAFNSNVLEVVGITEGDLLEGGGLDAFFYDNSSGRINLAQTRIDRTYDATTGDAVLASIEEGDGVDGSGTLVTIEFMLKEFAEEALGVHNVQLSNSEGSRVSYSVLIHPVVATDQFPAEDINRDGIVNVLDLTAVAGSLGSANPINPRADVNDDSIVNALDLVMVAQKLGTSTPAANVRGANVDAPKPILAPAAHVENLRSETIQGWIDIAQVEDDGSAIFDLGIANLERLLAATVPSHTKLLLNYPNPFNPETWIPYQLATATDVSVSIYSVNGTLVRTLALGHQAAGVYQSKSQAAYWDGRNEIGEQVASGVYFYTLTAGGFSATGKMLVRK